MLNKTRIIWSIVGMFAVFISWAIVVWCIFYIPIVTGAMVLGAAMSSWHWVEFIKKSRYDVLNDWRTKPKSKP